MDTIWQRLKTFLSALYRKLAAMVRRFFSFRAPEIKSIVTFTTVLLVILYSLLYWHLKHQKCIFLYAHLPEKVIERGYTDTYVVNLVNTSIRAIQEFKPEFRPYLESINPKSLKIKKTFAVEQVQAIEHLEVSGISVQTLILLSDKFFGWWNVKVDNYLSLEFSESDSSSLQLAATMHGKRVLFEEPIRPDLNETLALLSHKVAKFVLEESDPTILMAYYFDNNRYEECIGLCINTLAKFTEPDIRSNAFGFWGLSLFHVETYQLYHGEALAKLRVAANFDITNDWDKAYHLVSLNSKIQEGDYRTLDSLIKADPLYLPYFNYRFVYTSLSLRGPSDYPKLDTLMRALSDLKNYHSEVYFQYATFLRDWGKEDLRWYDSSIVQYQKGIDMELKQQPDQQKLANYYNNLAYTHELKIMDYVLSSNKAYKDNIAFELGMCRLNAMQGIEADSSNKWAYSTLCEYHGLRYLINRSDKKELYKFERDLTKAYRLGLPLSLADTTERPYNLMNKNGIFKRVTSQPKLYEGPLGELRLLKIL